MNHISKPLDFRKLLTMRASLPDPGAPPASRIRMANPMVHWELMVTDVARAKTFYGRVFGWAFSSYGPEYTTIDPGGAPQGGLMARPPSAPAAALNVYFQVADIERSLRDVVEAGGSVAVAKTEIPPGWFAMFIDPDGIAVGILQQR